MVVTSDGIIIDDDSCSFVGTETMGDHVAFESVRIWILLLIATS